MTQATALAEPPPPGITNPPSRGSFVMNLIVTLLAPIFLGIVGGDIGLAHMAAAETLEDYRVRTQLDPIAVAQIVLNGLAALDSISRSMADDLSLEAVLRLRCNSIGLNRAAEQNRRVRRVTHQPDAVSFQTAGQPDPEPPAPVAACAMPAEPDVVQTEPPAHCPASDTLAPPTEPPADPTPDATDEKRLRRMRAMAMVNEVVDLKASLRSLPQAEHRDVETRIAALDRTVYELLTATKPTGPGGGEAYASG